MGKTPREQQEVRQELLSIDYFTSSTICDHCGGVGGWFWMGEKDRKHYEKDRKHLCWIDLTQVTIADLSNGKYCSYSKIKYLTSTILYQYKLSKVVISLFEG